MNPAAIESTGTRGKDAATEREALRMHLHGMWASVAGAWEANAAYTDARGAAVSARMLELTAPGPGECVLELACGAGGPGLDAADLVGPEGEIVLSDVAAEMTVIAAARATARGLANTTARVRDLERIDEPDGAFDVVLCREGLMLVPDPALAAREIRRVLRPGGRVSVAVWGSRERNPWLGVVFATVADAFGERVPPPGLPHPFSLDDPDRLAHVLATGGPRRRRGRGGPVPLPCGVGRRVVGANGRAGRPAGAKARGAFRPDARALRARAAEAIGRYATPAGLEIPGVSLVASARRR